MYTNDFIHKVFVDLIINLDLVNQTKKYVTQFYIKIKICEVIRDYISLNL